MTINTTGLLEPQVPHVKRLVNSINVNGFAFDLSETGTGKTYTAAAVIRELNRPFVVICPKTVIPQWQGILDKFKLKAVTVINYEMLVRGGTKWMKWKKLADPLQPWVPEAKRDIPEFRFDTDTLVIVDEVHKCKGNDTSSSWLLIALKLQSYKVLGCSATCATSPLEMKAFGFVSGLHSLYNFNDFCRIHGGEWVGRWGAMTWNAGTEMARKSMMALNEYLFQTKACASRMVVEDFGNLFPESHIVADAYDLGPTEGGRCQQVYDDMEAEIARLDERSADYSQHIFAIMMEARRRAELCKIPTFVDMVEDLFDEGKSVVVFLNFHDSVEALIKRLEKNKKLRGLISFIVGGQDAKQRQNDIEAFQSDKKRIMICNIAAGGVGVSLHDLNGNFPRASIVSPNYSAYQLVQALGRVWRQGGLTKSYQRIVFAAGTIEEQACRRVQFRINNLSTLNDADMRAGIKMFE